MDVHVVNGGVFRLPNLKPVKHWLVTVCLLLQHQLGQSRHGSIPLLAWGRRTVAGNRWCPAPGPRCSVPSANTPLLAYQCDTCRRPTLLHFVLRYGVVNRLCQKLHVAGPNQSCDLEFGYSAQGDTKDPLKA